MHRKHDLKLLLVIVSVSLSWPAFASLVTQPAAPSIYAVEILPDPTFKPRVYAAYRNLIEQDVAAYGMRDCCQRCARSECLL